MSDYESLYKVIKKILKEHNKTIDDIKFITSKSDYIEYEFNIDKDLFIREAKGLYAINMNDVIKIVGEDFWLESKNSDQYFNYFDYFEIPKKCDITMDEAMLAKQLLSQPKVDKNFLLGIEYEEPF